VIDPAIVGYKVSPILLGQGAPGIRPGRTASETRGAAGADRRTRRNADPAAFVPHRSIWTISLRWWIAGQPTPAFPEKATVIQTQRAEGISPSQTRTGAEKICRQLVSKATNWQVASVRRKKRKRGAQASRPPFTTPFPPQIAAGGYKGLATPPSAKPWSLSRREEGRKLYEGVELGFWTRAGRSRLILLHGATDSVHVSNENALSRVSRVDPERLWLDLSPGKKAPTNDYKIEKACAGSPRAVRPTDAVARGRRRPPSYSLSSLSFLTSDQRSHPTQIRAHFHTILIGRRFVA